MPPQLDIEMLSAELEDPADADDPRVIAFEYVVTEEGIDEFQVGVYRSANNLFDPQDDVQIGNLLTMTATSPGRHGGRWTGDIPRDAERPYILVMADPADRVNESNEHNNECLLQPENYAVLFSGGWNEDWNHPWYYDNVKRLYQTLVGQYGLDQQNVYILCADGTSPEVDRRDGQNSDMSFARDAHVLRATPHSLHSTLQALADQVSDQDHFFFWSHDHGQGTENDPSDHTEERLVGWHDFITDDELAASLRLVKAGYTTYVFTQCFAGGMLEELLPMAKGKFGCASSNHYESAWEGPNSGFAAMFTEALQWGRNRTHSAYEHAQSRTPNALSGGQSGQYQPGMQHPWMAGDTFTANFKDRKYGKMTDAGKTYSLSAQGFTYMYAYASKGVDVFSHPGSQRNSPYAPPAAVVAQSLLTQPKGHLYTATPVNGRAELSARGLQTQRRFMEEPSCPSRKNRLSVRAGKDLSSGWEWC